MTANLAHCLRLAESLPDEPGTYRVTRELITELRHLIAATLTIETITNNIKGGNQ